MFRSTTTIIILLLTLFSCGQPTSEDVVENTLIEDDYIFSTTDSLLNIADDRMRNIRKHSDDVNERIKYLEDKNELYDRHIEKLTIKIVNLMNSLDSVTNEKERVITSLNETIRNKDIIIQLNRKSIKHKESVINEITDVCESEIENLTSTITLLNDSIQDIMDIVNENMKPNKVEKVFGE